jgi:hypothetical protein
MDTLTNLTSSIATLKEARALKDKPFPVEALLTLYCNARTKDVYCGYMEGFSLLVSWLSPITISPELIRKGYLPRYLSNYEINQLSDILGTNPLTIYYILNKIFEAKKGNHSGHKTETA